VFATPIREAIEEWQELKLEEARPPEPHIERDNPFPESHFRRQQWNLENHDRRGLDINVRAAWDQLHIWQGEPAAARQVRVALIDMAVDLEHPAMVCRFDHALARNLDYPNVAGEGFVEAFRSASSAHAIACAGIIAADALAVRRPAANGHPEQDEPGCLGIAPHCTIIPYRAMTLTEPVMHKRQILARAVLEVATGVTFEPVAAPAGSPRPKLRWTAGNTRRPAADILFLPLPLEPLPDDQPDPLALALAFAATRIPVIIPSGNKGTSSLGYLSDPAKDAPDPASVDDLSKLFDLDRAGVDAVFGAPARSDQQIIEGLLLALRRESAAICVASCNDRGRRSRYSQYGEGLTVVAPSDDVRPAHPVKSGAVEALPRSIATTDLVGIGGYMQDQSHYTLSDNEFGFGGTSAAGAQVTGVVALMLEANPRLRPTEVREILRDTARVRLETAGDLLTADDGQMPSRPSAEFGYGLVDAARAVEEALRRAEQAAASDR
jgi:subtilisin family serine protease